MQHDYQQLLARAREHKDHGPHEKARWQAIRDYVAIQGKIVKVNFVLAYYKADQDGSDGRKEIILESPALVRIHKNEHPDSITGLIHDNTIDPEWTASLVEPHDQLDEDVWDVEKLTVFGTAYSTQTGDVRPDGSLYWEQLDPQPKNPGTLEVERETIKALKASRGQIHNGGNVKTPKLDKPVGMNADGLKEHRSHADNIAQIIAAGLAAGSGKGRIKQAISLYLEVTQADVAQPQKPTIEVDRPR